MRNLIYIVGASMDGRIAGPGGEIDVFPTPPEYLHHLATELPETLPTHVRPHVGAAEAPNRLVDTVIQGAATYRPALDVGITSPFAHLRQYVASTSMTSPDPDVTVVADPVQTVRALKAEDGLGIWLAGGARLAGALLPEIDEVILKLYPVMLGRGVPVLDGAFDVAEFACTATRSFDSGHTVLHYARQRS